MRVPLYVMCSFSLFAFKILSLSLIFVSLITLCLSVFLLEFVLPWTLFYILVNHFLHLLNLCLHFPPTSCIIFTSIILNSFSGSLPISTSFSCFSGILSCPFFWDMTFCFFTVIIVVQALSHVQLFATPWITACQASFSFTISCSLLRLISIDSVMPSNHLILRHPLLLLPSIFPIIRVFSNE